MTESPSVCAVSVCDRPTRDGATICDRCRDVLRQQLAETPAQVDELVVTLIREKSSRTDTGSTHGTRNQPMPFNLRAADVLRDLSNVLVSWTRMLAEERGWSLPTTIPDPAYQAKACSRWLLAAIDTIRLHEAGGDCADEISMALTAVSHVVDIPPERVYAGPCECGADLYAKPGQPLATCQRCESTYPVEAMQDWMRAQVSERLVTAREGAGLLCRFGLEVQQKTIDKWAERKRLEVKGHDQQGRRLYLFGDLTTLAARAETHRPRDDAA